MLTIEQNVVFSLRSNPALCCPRAARPAPLELRGPDQAGLREDPSQDAQVHRGPGLRARASLRVSARPPGGSGHRVHRRDIPQVSQGPASGVCSLVL